MMSDEEAREFSDSVLLPEAKHLNNFTLLSTQATAVRDYQELGGMIGPIGVGWGKTGISIMIAELANRKGLKRSILFVEPGCLDQLANSDIPYWRRRFPLAVKFHMIGGKPKAARAALYKSGYKGCYIIPYSLLSRPDAMDMLAVIDPDLVIADESHNLKDLTTARVKRVLHMMEGREREFIPMSGTMTTKGLSDYGHLADLALKDGSPLPRPVGMREAWANLLDTNASSQPEAHSTGPIEGLVEWARPLTKGRYKGGLRMDLTGIRRAWQERWITCPGVVSTGDKELGISLTISNTEIKDPESYEGFDRLSELMKDVEEAGITPNGDELECALSAFKWLVELSAGFYNELYWPEASWVQKVFGGDLGRAEGALSGAQDVHACQQLYHSAMRRFLEHSPAGVDTAMTVGGMIYRGLTGSIPTELTEAYWSYHDEKDRCKAEYGFVVERLGKVVRVCDYKIQAAVKWAAEHRKGGILWVTNIAMGKWAFEAIQAAGLDPVHCPAGGKFNKVIGKLGDPEQGGKGDRLVVASLKAHGSGKNLQAFQSQFFLQWPRDSKTAEQGLGRLHRTGQKADSLVVHTCNTVIHEHVQLAACLNDAVYQHTTGNPRKMVIATYDPLPFIYSHEFLQASGAKPTALSPKQRELIEERFGRIRNGA